MLIKSTVIDLLWSTTNAIDQFQWNIWPWNKANRRWWNRF